MFVRINPDEYWRGSQRHSSMMPRSHVVDLGIYKERGEALVEAVQEAVDNPPQDKKITVVRLFFDRKGGALTTTTYPASDQPAKQVQVEELAAQHEKLREMQLLYGGECKYAHDMIRTALGNALRVQELGLLDYSSTDSLRVTVEALQKIVDLLANPPLPGSVTHAHLCVVEQQIVTRVLPMANCIRHFGQSAAIAMFFGGL